MRLLQYTGTGSRSFRGWELLTILLARPTLLLLSLQLLPVNAVAVACPDVTPPSPGNQTDRRRGSLSFTRHNTAINMIIEDNDFARTSPVHSIPGPPVCVQTPGSPNPRLLTNTVTQSHTQPPPPQKILNREQCSKNRSYPESNRGYRNRRSSRSIRIRCDNRYTIQPCHRVKKMHIQHQGIRWSSPTQLLVWPSLVYRWESGRDPEFPSGDSRM